MATPAKHTKTSLQAFLFTDIVGSTDLKRRLGDIDGAQVIAEHDLRFRECVDRFGGVEQNNPGDGFFATFPVPSAALNCALAFRTALADKIQARVGIHMGEAVHVPGAADAVKLLGLAVDTAGRVMSLAMPNQILITRHAFDSARQQVLHAPNEAPVVWRAHGAYAFKGLDEPIEVFEAGIEGLSPLRAPRDSAKARRVRAMDVPAERTRRNRARRETKMYGRDGDLARLGELYQLAAQGEGQAVLLEGEAGIGKTRLLEEFLDTLDDTNILVGAYEPASAATTSGAYSRAFREHFGPDLERVVPAFLPETPRLAPAFVAHMRGDAPPEGTEPLTQESLQTVVVHAARNIARDRVTVIVIDDLHFAPELGRILFASLAYALPGHRLLLLGTARPGLPQKWIAQLMRLDHYTTHSVQRLSTADVEQLAGELATDDSFRARVARKAGGVPYFAVEILRAGADVEIPDSVQELILARVGALEAEDKELLEIASCCGAEFDPLLVGEVADLNRRALLKRLATIEREHRLVQFVDDRCVFDHHQIQETLYGGLSNLLRREYHTALAEAYAEQCDEEPTGDHAVFLAHHRLHGSRKKDASPHLEAAFDHLEQSYRNDTRLDLMQRALEVDGLVEGQRRAELLMRQAACLDLFGRRDEQRAALEEAAAVADAAGHQDLHAKALAEEGWLLYVMLQHDRARATLRKALEMVEATGHRRLEASFRGNLGLVLLGLGRHRDAQECFERSRSICREIGIQRGEASATANLGLVFFELGRYAEAKEQHESARELFCEIGYRLGEAITNGNLGLVFHGLGLYDEARRHRERHRELGREIGDRRSEGYALEGLAALAEDEGDVAGALRLYGEALALRRELGENLAETLVAHGRLEAASGDIEAAAEQLDEALALAQKMQSPNMTLSAAIELARLPDGDVEAALAAFTEHEGGVRHNERMNARFRLWELTGDDGHLVEAHRLLCDVRDNAPEDCRETMLENVPLLRNILKAWDGRGG